MILSLDERDEAVTVREAWMKDGDDCGFFLQYRHKRYPPNWVANP